MDDKRGQGAFEEIEGLVNEDKKRALRAFRPGRFEERVRDKVESYVAKERLFFRRRAAVLASVAALVLVAGGAVLILSRRSTPIPQGVPGPMMAVLEGLPGIADLVMPREIFPPGERESFGAARAVETVLTSAVGEKEAVERNAGPPRGLSKVPKLSLEKKMEILFKDRVIERVLVSILRRSEEV